MYGSESPAYPRGRSASGTVEIYGRAPRVAARKGRDFVTTTIELVTSPSTMRSVPPYARGGTRSNGGATWAMRSERVMGSSHLWEGAAARVRRGGVSRPVSHSRPDCRVGRG